MHGMASRALECALCLGAATRIRVKREVVIARVALDVPVSDYQGVQTATATTIVIKCDIYQEPDWMGVPQVITKCLVGVEYCDAILSCYIRCRNKLDSTQSAIMTCEAEL